MPKRTSGDATHDLYGKVIGNYKFLDMIAEGGFGKTFLGEHVIAKEPVCIKKSSETDELYDELLLRETKAIWDCRHFGIPVMRDLIRCDDDSLALVMSYIPGPTLKEIIDTTGRLDPEHVAWITERVLNVLHYLYMEHGVVHGDVKPQNIIIQPKKHTLVLVDYGLAMVKPSRDSRAIGHTPLFAPPEQINGSPLLPESDFYSLGMTMLYALGGGEEAVQRKQVPEDTPDELCEFIRRLIVRDVLVRPNWDKENLCQTIQKVRTHAFGRSHSDMKPIPGI